MKAKEIFDILLNRANGKLSPTCDRLIAGDGEKEVGLVATCFKLTAEVLDKAIKSGVDMIITHEPTFLYGDDTENLNPVDEKKLKMLADSKIALYRFHDHAHYRTPDYIHEGFLRDVGLEIKEKLPPESLGVCRYLLKEKTTAKKLARLIKERLNLDTVRISGGDLPVSSVTLGLGLVGGGQVEILSDPGSDVLITGEIGEVCALSHIKDMAFFGENKAVIILGHFGAEFAGMKLLADELCDLVPTVYLDCGEVFRCI